MGMTKVAKIFIKTECVRSVIDKVKMCRNNGQRKVWGINDWRNFDYYFYSKIME